jgi:uncharacterized protein (DUF4213/DUF364 family)
MLIEKLIEDIESALDERTVDDVRIGLGYTAVQLDDGWCGVASTVTAGGDHSCTQIEDAGELIGRPAIDLASRAALADPLQRTVGLATINALLNRTPEPDPGLVECVPLEGAVVGMIGHIPPVAAAIERAAAELRSFDRRQLWDHVRGEAAIDRLLPECDVAVITSQTLVNGTAERLLDLARGTVILIGPTTPIWDGFAEFGVSHLFGQVVTDASSILATVSQAGGTRRFRGAATKVHRHLERPG